MSRALTTILWTSKLTKTSLCRKRLSGTTKNGLGKGGAYNILSVDGVPVSVQLPLMIDMRVVEAFEGLKGDSSGNATKPVKLENGMTIQVPLFIKQGDVIKVRTEDESYVGRA